MRAFAFFIAFVFLANQNIFSQGCCSGGSGSPIAGGTSQGVLKKGQIEIGTNFQYLFSNKLYRGDKIDTAIVNQIDHLQSDYLYTRIAYGITKRLTLSVEGGYFFNKTLTRLHPENIDNTQSSKGIADLIIFPRYDLYDKTNSKYHTEITVGLGLKIPLGHCNDSGIVYQDQSSGVRYYTTLAPTVQTTNGSKDIIFYGFVFREFKKSGIRVFANTLYMHKGYNTLGEKFGDYSSIGLFIGKTFFKNLGTLLQVKGEFIDPMQAKSGVDILAKYNVDVLSTGSKKISIVPQLSYSFKSFNLFAFTDIPLYQYMNGIQIGSKYQSTIGFTYRFMANKPLWKIK